MCHNQRRAEINHAKPITYCEAYQSVCSVLQAQLGSIAGALAQLRGAQASSKL